MVGFKDVVLVLSLIFVVVLLKGICVVVNDRVVVRFTNWINVVVWECLFVVVCII